MFAANVALKAQKEKERMMVDGSDDEEEDEITGKMSLVSTAEFVLAAARRNVVNPVVRVRLQCKSNPKSVAVVMSSKSSAPSELTIATDAGDDDDDDGEDAKDKTRRSHADRVMSGGTVALSKNLEELPPDLHAATYKDVKKVECTIRILRRWGRLNGRINTDECQQLSNSCFDTADDLEDRQRFLVDMNQDFLKAAEEPLSDKAAKSMKGFSHTLACNMVVQGVGRISDKALEDSKVAGLVFMILCMDPRSFDITHGDELLGLNYVTGLIRPGDRADAATVVQTCQRAALRSHMEKMYNMSDMKAFVNAAAGITSAFNSLSPSALQTMFEEARQADKKFVCGFIPSGIADLIVTWLLSRLGQSHMSRTKSPRELIALTVAVSAGVTVVSSSIRCYFKASRGARTQPAKLLWNMLENMSNEKEKRCSNIFKEDDIQELIRPLEDLLPFGEVRGIALAVSELLHGEQRSEVVSFVEASATFEEGGLKSLAAKLYDSLVKAVRHILDEQNSFFEILKADGSMAEDGDDDDATVAGDGVDKPVLDDAHWRDPFNHTEDFALLTLVKDGLGLLAKFGEAPYESLITSAKSRAEHQCELWIASRLQVTEQFPLLAKFKLLSQLYRHHIWLVTDKKSKRPLECAEHHALHAFTDRCAASTGFDQNLCATLRKAIALGGACALSITRECSGLEGTMPKVAHGLIRASRAFDLIEDTAGRISSGKTSLTVADLNEVMAEYKFAESVCEDEASQRPLFTEAVKKVSNEFCTIFHQFDKEMGKMMTACTMMQELGGGILKASKMWNFANCDFVYKGARGTNARIVAASKLIHQLATQFENIKSQVMRLSAKSSWLLEETKKAVDRLAKGFEHTYQEQLTKAVEIVSHILIINSILGGGDGAPAETKWPKVAEKWVLHCQRTLNFPSGRLDKTLLKKIKWGRKNDTIDTDTAKKPEKTQQQEDDATKRNRRMMRRRRVSRSDES